MLGNPSFKNCFQETEGNFARWSALFDVFNNSLLSIDIYDQSSSLSYVIVLRSNFQSNHFIFVAR